MASPQVMLIRVAGNDIVLFLNSKQIVSAEGGTRDCFDMVTTAADSLADFFEVELETLDTDAPAIDDWTFDDVRRDLLRQGILRPHENWLKEHKDLKSRGTWVFPGPDQPGYYYFQLDGVCSDISYESKSEAWAAAIAQSGLNQEKIYA